MNTNRKILDMLKSAPDSQLSANLRKKCQEFNGSDEELKAFFAEMYKLDLSYISSFVKAMINPEFTSKY